MKLARVVWSQQVCASVAASSRTTFDQIDLNLQPIRANDGRIYDCFSLLFVHLFAHSLEGDVVERAETHFRWLPFAFSWTWTGTRLLLHGTDLR